MVKTFSKTDVGRIRKINQDYVFTSERAVGNLPNLFIVADGMGGHKAGGFASAYTVENIVAFIKRESVLTDPIKVLDKAINVANELLLAKSREDPDLEGMGTTLVMFTIIDNEMYVANIGDSRLYVCDNRLHQVTKDHSLVEEMVRMGEIRPEDARLHPDKNIITRAVGISDTVKVDYFVRPLNENDIIMMCTDGLTNMVKDPQIFEIMSRGRDTVEITDNLIKAANNNGGKDNIGVVVVEVSINNNLYR